MDFTDAFFTLLNCIVLKNIFVKYIISYQHFAHKTKLLTSNIMLKKKGEYFLVTPTFSYRGASGKLLDIKAHRHIKDTYNRIEGGKNI